VKRIVILGSTGSIGRSTLDVIRNNSREIKIRGLSTKQNIDLLYKQIQEFKPSHVSVWDENKAEELKKRVGNSVIVYSGLNGLLNLANLESDLVVSSLVGGIGLEPTLAAIKSGKNIALANKEVLVMAGAIVQREAKRHKVSLIPIDSEHSALMQCLWKREPDEIKKVILTASGGPFYNKSYSELKKITPELALKHPTWKMGQKVTIDSATLMNKGFEVIEASFLFDIPIDKIDVVIHPESIVHAMVEFIDGSICAVMHNPDMKIPIQYALSWPKRWRGYYGIFNLTKIGTLSFIKPDFKKFPALELAYNAAKIGGTMPSVLSGADEVCVEKFLKGEIEFLDIVKYVKSVINMHKSVNDPSLDDILEADKWARINVLKKISAS